MNPNACPWCSKPWLLAAASSAAVVEETEDRRSRRAGVLPVLGCGCEEVLATGTPVYRAHSSSEGSSSEAASDSWVTAPRLKEVLVEG